MPRARWWRPIATSTNSWPWWSEGALKFDLDGREILVSAGQALAIPSGVPHGVEAMEDTVVMDLFTPRRQDWIDGDDSYLRR